MTMIFQQTRPDGLAAWRRACGMRAPAAGVLDRLFVSWRELCAAVAPKAVFQKPVQGLGDGGDCLEAAPHFMRLAPRTVGS